MKRIIVGDKQRVADWVSKKIGCNKWQVDFEAIGLEQNGQLVGGVVFDNYVEKTRCSTHVAGEGKCWLNREFLKVVFDYIFRQLGCKVIVASIKSHNMAALHFSKRIGFDEAGRVENGAPNGDLVVLQLPVAKCRWLEKKS